MRALVELNADHESGAARERSAALIHPRTDAAVGRMTHPRRHRRQPRPCGGTGRTAGGGMLPPPPPSPRGSVRRLRAVERVPLLPPPVCWLAPYTSCSLSLIANPQTTLTVVCMRRVRTTRAEPGAALTAGGSATIARSVSITGGGAGGPFQRHLHQRQHRVSARHRRGVAAARPTHRQRATGAGELLFRTCREGCNGCADGV
jgi:hypothetical protein